MPQTEVRAGVSRHSQVGSQAIRTWWRVVCSVAEVLRDDGGDGRAALAVQLEWLDMTCTTH